MNRGQAKLVGSWVAAGVLIAVGVTFNDWVVAHWSQVRLPLLLVAVVLAAYYQSKGTVRDPNLNPFVIYQRTPMLRAWLAIYGLIVAGGVMYIFVRDSHLLEGAGLGVILMLLAPLLLPPIVVSVARQYRALADE